MLIARTALVSASCLGAQALLAAPAITATKDDGLPANTKVAPGGTINYTNTITNSGPDAATGVQFKDPATPGEIPGTTYVPASLKVTPFARNDGYPDTILPNTSVNTSLTSFNPLANDYAGYNNGSALSTADLSVTPLNNVATAAGGRVTMTADGKFIYTPAAGYTGADSFTYTVLNGVSGGASTSVQGVISLTVGGEIIWYVDPNVATTGDGRLGSPFKTLAEAFTAIGSRTNHRIFLYQSSTAQTGTFTLNNGGWLVGQAASGTNFATVMGVTFQPGTSDISGAAVSAPVLVTIKPVITNGAGNTLVGSGTNKVYGVTISNSGGGYALSSAGTIDLTVGSTSLPSDVTISSSGTSQGGVSIGAGAGGAQVSAPITSTAGRSLNITGRTNSTLGFSGAISDQGTGINLTNNTGATIALTGGLNISTGANIALNATGGGTLRILQNNISIVNTLQTTTATALNVQNTQIDSLGIIFRSITSSGGTSNGINLVSTGTGPSNGGLTVTGDGTNTSVGGNGSGGSIQNRSGSDGATNAGIGIYLSDTKNVVLRRMTFPGTHQNYGILGYQVNNFTMEYCRLEGTYGTSVSGIGEGAVYFGNGSALNGVTGTGRVDSCAISGGRYDNFSSRNISGTLDRFTVNNSTFGHTQSSGSNDSLAFESRNTGTIVRATVTGCTFTGARGDAASFVGQSGATFDTIFQNNSSTNNHPNNNVSGGGLFVGGFTNTTFNISGNNLSGADGSAITLQMGAPVSGSALATSLAGTINNNVIGISGSPNSGSKSANGIFCSFADNETSPKGQVTLAVTNNQIRNFNFAGFYGDNTSGNYDVNLTFTGNTIEQPGTNAFATFALTAGAPTSTDDIDVFARVTGNTFNGALNAGDVYFGAATATSTMKLAGTGSPANNTSFASQSAITNFLTANNTIAGGAVYNLLIDSPATVANFLGAGTTNPPLPSPLTFAPGGVGSVEAAPVVPSGIPPIIAEAPQANAPAAAVEVAEMPVKKNVLTRSELDLVVKEAYDRWVATGLTREQISTLSSLKFEIADLAYDRLGEAGGDLIRIDDDALGNGWFTGTDEASDALFDNVHAATRRVTSPEASAAGRLDLLTTVLHEMGHTLGLGDTIAPQDRDSIMYGVLMRGERRLPAKDQAKGAVHSHEKRVEFLTTPNPLNIGTLPPDKAIVVTYSVTVNDPPTAASISSQGTVSGSNFPDVLTDDPQAAGTANPTVTQIELPDVTVSVSPASVLEDSGSEITYTFTRAGGTGSALTVKFTNDGTATYNTDYTLGVGTGTVTFNGAGGTIVIPANASSATMKFIPTTDLAVESNETILIGIDATGGVFYDAGTPNSATATITNDDTEVSVAVSPASVTEDGIGTLVYTFTRTGVTSVGLAANVGFTGTATQASSDYSVTTPAATTVNADGTGIVTFPAGATTVSVTIDPLPDNAVEGNETVIATVLSGTGYSPAGTPATGTINNDDSTVTLAVSPASMSEDATGVMTYTFTRASGPTTNALTVGFTVGGTATLTTDYTVGGATSFTSTAGTVTFAANSSTATVTIDPVTDTDSETNETVILTLSANASTPATTGGYEVGTAGGVTATINDDDLPQVTIAVSSANVTEGGWVDYTFTRTSSVGALTANFQLDASSTAIAATDFIISGTGVTFDTGTGAGTVSFANGQNSVTASLSAWTEYPVGGGQEAEAAETVRLNVVPVANVYGGTGNATVTIAANGYVVVNTNDTGGGSLRQAVANSLAVNGAKAIAFAGPVFTDGTADVISLSSSLGLGSLDDGLLRIDGTGADRLTIRAATSGYRLLTIATGKSVHMRNLTVADGNVGLTGANILTNGNLTMTGCAVVNGTSTLHGGGIANGTPGVVSLVNCTISGNTGNSANGGGAIDSTSATLNLINTTISGNTNLTNGTTGAGAIWASGTVTIVNSTITGNVIAAGGTNAGGLRLSTGVLTISNSIIAGNQNNTTVPDVSRNTGLPTSNGGNLIGNPGNITTFTGTGDQVGNGTTPLDPKLTALGNNGGPTQTHALLPDSSALNAGLNSNLPVDTFDLDGDNDTGEDIPYDQRGAGFVRAVGTVDIGAVELQKSLSIAADETSYGEAEENAVFTVSRTGPTTGVATVTYTVSGSGTHPASALDFGGTFPTGTATIEDGEESVTISIPITDDSLVEMNETFQVTLTSPSGDYAITNGVAEVAILDNDTATLSVAKITDAQEEGPVSGVFRITQSVAATADTTVSFSFGGSAQPGFDFDVISFSTVIPANSTSVDVLIPVARDNIFEPEETVTLTLTGVSNSAPGVSIAASPADTASMTIADDRVTISVFSDSGTSTTVNTNFSSTMLVRVRGSEGEYVWGAPVTFSVPATGASGTFAGSNTVTVMSDGFGFAASPTLTANTLAGTYSLSATIDGIDQTLSRSRTNTPGAAAGFVVTGPTSSTAGSPVDVTVTVQDAFGNLVTNFTGTIQFTSSDVSAGLPSNYTFVAGDNGSRTFPVTLRAGGNHTVTATSTSSSSVTGTSGAIAVDPRADLSITNTNGGTTVTAGQAVSYTITVGNAGPSAITGATVTDVLPVALNGATWNAVPAGGASAATLSGTGNINESVTLPVGGSVTYTVNATVSPAATGTLTNTATITAPGSGTDPITTNNSATDEDTILVSGDLAITKTDGVTSAVPGGSVTYTITASNAGPSNIVGATITDALPPSLTATWTSTVFGGASATAAGSGNINDTVVIPAGGSVVYTVSATINAAATGDLINTATIAVPSGSSDGNPANNSATDEDSLTPQANLGITVTDGAASVAAGGPVSYTITVSNAGLSNAPGATVNNTFPASLSNITWTTTTAGGGTATASGSGNISDSVNLPAGGSVTYTVNATLSPSATGTLSNTATVTAPAGVTDPSPGNNSSTDQTAITASANLGITVTDNATSAVPGMPVTYTIVASNAGPSNASSATVADTFPASLTNITWSTVTAGGATATASGSGNIADAVNLPAGSSVTYTVNATISPGATTTLSNTATISSSVADPNPANNSSTDTTTLTPEADLSVAIVDSPDPVDAGGVLTYTITVNNAGPSNAPLATLEASFPANFTITSVNLPPTWLLIAPVVGNSGPLNVVGGLQPGSAVITVTGSIPYLPNNTVLTASATVGSSVTDLVSSNNTATATTTVRAIPEIAVFDGLTELTDGQSGTIDFGSTTVGLSIVRTFRIHNPGTGNLIVSGITLPTGFALAGISPDFPFTVTPTQSADVTVVYTAPAVGTQTGTLSFASNDDNEASFDFPISGTRLNVAPVAVGGSVTIDEDEVTDISLAANDGDGNALTYSVVTGPSHGSFTLSGNVVTYTPTTNYNGTDSFTFLANDGVVNSNTVTVNITIDPVNDTPVWAGTGMQDLTQIKPGLSDTIDLADHFTDVETASSALTYTVTPAVGTPFYTLVRNGTELTITGDAPGTVDITVTAEDPEGESVSDTFTLLVKHVPSMPNGGVPNTLVSPSATSHEIDLANYIIDLDGDPLTFSVPGNSDPTKASAQFTGSVLSITPLAPGITNLTIRATDSDGNFIEDVVEITVDDPIPTLTEGGIAPAPRLNVQTGLYEVPVVATNNNQFDVPGFRMRVTSALPAGFRLYNATSPAGEAQPYLDVLTRLRPGDTIVVVLEFFSSTRNFDNFDPTIIAEPLPTDIQNDATGMGTEVTRFVRLGDGSVLMEFASIPGHTYRLEYSDDLVTWKRSLVPIRAAANYTQWIDRGAPYTETHPSTSSSRFYRVSDITEQN